MPKLHNLMNPHSYEAFRNSTMYKITYRHYNILYKIASLLQSVGYFQSLMSSLQNKPSAVSHVVFFVYFALCFMSPLSILQNFMSFFCKV